MEGANRLKDNDELKKLLKDNGYEDGVVLFDSPSYTSAFVGVSNDNRAIYDYNRMVESLVEKGMSYEEATEFVDYNTVRSLDYISNGPIILYTLQE